MGSSGTGIRQLIGKLFGKPEESQASDVPVFGTGDYRPRFVDHNFLTPETIKQLEREIGYSIRHAAYFEQALTHRSFLQLANIEGLISNERMEFLGDSILNMLIGEFLFHNYTDIQEGELTKLRSRLVNRKALTVCAHTINLHKFVLLNTSAEQSLEQGNDSLIADAFEAIIAAIYLDSGSKLEPVKKFLMRTLLNAAMFERILFTDENYKSILLEYAQGNTLGIPRYSVVKEEGPDHERVFTVEVYVNDQFAGQGTGRSKKAAEQKAAAEAIEALGIQTE